MSSAGRPATAEALGLTPHPEGGWYRETWTADPHAEYRPAGYPGPRRAASGIYFLLEPDQESRWHKVRSDELWLWHRGGPLLLSLGGAGEAPDRAHVTEIVLGPDVEAGRHPQALVPGGHWQAARPLTDQEVLVSCVVAPAFHFDDFVLEEAAGVRAEASAELPVPADRAWRVVSAFDDVHTWHPLIAESVPEPGLPPGLPGHIRRTVTGSGDVIRERLLRMGDRRCVHEFAEAPFPVRVYRSTLAIESGPDAHRCRAVWRAEFTPEDPADGDGLREYFVNELLAPGLRGLAAAATRTAV